MKAGLVGLPGAGKTTLFRAITRSRDGEPWRAVAVPDTRVERLAALFRPRKVTYARVHVQDFPGVGGDPAREARLLGEIRDMDALALVVRAFEDPSYPHEEPSADVARDLGRLQDVFQLADYVVIENRVEKLSKQVHKPTPRQEQDRRELQLLERLKAHVEAGGLIGGAEIAPSEEPLVRGFRFLTQKPSLVVLNLPDEGADEEALRARVPDAYPQVIALRGGLEAEIAALDPGDVPVFMAEYGLETTAREALIAGLYDLLGLCSFMTVGEDEVRAWTIPKGATAWEAAGVIHSDLQRGFIRAEVVGCEELLEAGGMKAAKAANLVRVEGKDHPVRDGDVVHIRFNV